jgi:anaerobic carbon-monoxide dehydrogenase iron sulfur subunit
MCTGKLKRLWTMKKIVAKQEACMGCGLCEVYCTVAHSKTKDVIKAYNSERPKPVARVRREVQKPISFAIQCRHCEDAPCVVACLAGAMTKDPQTGEVKHNKDKCIGCWTCIMVCPYSAIRMDKENKVVAKCDLCQGLKEPQCVANCPNEALEFKEVRS